MVSPSDRYIALVDLDAFYASVEALERPELVGRPLLIGGSPTGRGVVAAASYEARAFGCHSAMPMARALRLCPGAVVLSPRFTVYRAYSKRVMDILARESDLVEQMSIDEAYVDLTPIASTIAEAESLGRRMQGRIRVELGLPCSVGLASSKTVAKVACEAGKPAGFVVVRPGAEAEFLAGLPVGKLPGIGPRSAERLKAAGFDTLGMVAEAPVAQLTSVLGPWGAALQRRARGEDSSPVRTERQTKSVSAEETFAEDVAAAAELHEEIAKMSERIAGSLGAARPHRPDGYAEAPVGRLHHDHPVGKPGHCDGEGRGHPGGGQPPARRELDGRRPGAADRRGREQPAPRERARPTAHGSVDSASRGWRRVGKLSTPLGRRYPARPGTACVQRYSDVRIARSDSSIG